MAIHKDQRVGVFVDVQNLFYSARHLYKHKVNFAAVLKEAVANRKLIRAIAYVVKAEDTDTSFFDALEKIGFDIKIKELQVFYGGHKKGDWDVGLSMDAIEQANKLDVVVLVSGDGDYEDLVQHLKRAIGCRVEVLAFGKSASSKLKNCADEFVDLDTHYQKFLLRVKK
jgi:uncharacterized LabA/DUF88 family protein